ncbi:hypothetical protein MKEN_01111800 [Mycena kentingensis (nom. inval.)]|nr:hypothetical protein MKEN_01111800 [Mycena kentingensis (nom. inval.)]
MMVNGDCDADAAHDYGEILGIDAGHAARFVPAAPAAVGALAWENPGGYGTSTTGYCGSLATQGDLAPFTPGMTRPHDASVYEGLFAAHERPWIQAESCGPGAITQSLECTPAGLGLSPTPMLSGSRYSRHLRARPPAPPLYKGLSTIPAAPEDQGQSSWQYSEIPPPPDFGSFSAAPSSPWPGEILRSPITLGINSVHGTRFSDAEFSYPEQCSYGPAVSSTLEWDYEAYPAGAESVSTDIWGDFPAPATSPGQRSSFSRLARAHMDNYRTNAADASSPKPEDTMPTFINYTLPNPNDTAVPKAEKPPSPRASGAAGNKTRPRVDPWVIETVGSLKPKSTAPEKFCPNCFKTGVTNWRWGHVSQRMLCSSCGQYEYRRGKVRAIRLEETKMARCLAGGHR